MKTINTFEFELKDIGNVKRYTKSYHIKNFVEIPNYNFKSDCFCNAIGETKQNTNCNVMFTNKM